MLRVADYYSGSDTGRQRRHNEDAVYARAPLFVVADGMGGAQAGEVASRTAVDVFGHGLKDGANPEQSLAARVQEANALIHELSQSNAEQAGMGTTLTAAYVGPEEVSIAHVGDSRAYCLRDGQLLRLTEDHSLVDELMRQGRLTPEEAEDHPQRSIITRALGPEPAVDVDTHTHRGRAGDVYLLCSDGLTTMVPEDQVAEIIATHPLLREAGEALVSAANQAGGRDNITVVLFRLEEVGQLAGDDQPTTIGQLESDRADTEDHAESAAAAALPPPGTRVASAPTAGAAVRERAAPGQRRHRGPGGGVARRLPRRPPSKTRGPRRRFRRLVAPMLGLGLVILILLGGYIASQSVYFIGTDSRGFVTVFQGVPYEIPGGLRLYSANFVSGVPAASLPAQRRRALLDHSLRSHNDATDLVRRLERGELSTP